MSRRRYISSEISLDSKLNRVSDFAALFYTWGIAHARDDCRISPENAEELLNRVVPGRHKNALDVQMAIGELKLAGLLGVDEDGELYYPSKSFYKYQTYVSTGNRRETPENSVSVSPSPSPSGSYQNKNPDSASPGRRLKNDSETEGDTKMPSMNLIPELKAAADAIYYSDPVKFKRLAAWIGQGRKHGWSEESMAAALREFWDYRAVTEWYAYLDTILQRVDKDRSRDASDEEHRKHKEEVREASKMFLVK